MFEVHLFLAIIFCLVTLTFRFGGDRVLFRVVNDQRLTDRTQFNRYISVRMLIPTSVAVCCAALSYDQAMLGIPLIFAIPLSLLCAIVWILIGSKRFLISAS
jgi:hypothetical protein